MMMLPFGGDNSETRAVTIYWFEREFFCALEW